MNYELFDNFKYNNDVHVTNETMEQQFSDYKKLNYNQIKPFMDKYFTPTQEIHNIINEIEKKYNINYENTCVVFHRGNLKYIETNLPSYNDYITKINEIKEKNPGIKFLFQSDEFEFLNIMNSKYPNNIILNDYIRYIQKGNIEVDRIDQKNNFEFSKKYLAITNIMSKCKHIICGSGNCSLWIVLYRGNAENLHQYLNPLNGEVKENYWI
jgi:hypothetical protein